MDRIEPTQADRDAAKSILWVSTLIDDEEAIVQALARHRLASTPAPDAEPVALNACPPGLFMFNGTLGFKSEYVTTLENPRRYQCDAYVVESGEYFHGGAKNSTERGKLRVTPIEYSAPAVTVTDEMVDAGYRAWYESAGNTYGKILVRAILTAAMGG